MEMLPAGIRAARWGVYVGAACGVLYAVGGFFYDLATTGLNPGTALAFMALVGMPILFGAAGFVAGVCVGAVGSAVAHLRGGRRAS